MKKLLIASLVAIAPVIASAQVQLISGFNFGQFLYGGEPVVDYAGGALPTVGSVSSNFGGLVSPGAQDGGVYKFGVGEDGTFTAGSSMLYFDGTNGSHNFDPFGGGTPGSVTVTELAAIDAANGQTVVPTIQMYSGDDNNASLRLTSSGSINRFSIVTDTTGFTDYASGQIPFDTNFSFASTAITGSGSVEFFLGATSLGSFSVNPGVNQAFSMDLPPEFYGDSDATLIGVVTGDLSFDHIQINGFATPIPEPSTYAAILGVCTLGFAMLRRRQAALGQMA